MAYTQIIGMDVGKTELVIARAGTAGRVVVPNTAAGVSTWLQTAGVDAATLVVVEPTGGYERLVIEQLLAAAVVVHRANARQVKAFIRSYGTLAKTDAIDAHGLARYGLERQATLVPYQPPSATQARLAALFQRRQELVQLRVAERNRLQSPGCTLVRDSIQAVLTMLTAQSDTITAELQALIADDPILQAKAAVVQTIPGVGPLVAAHLLATLPELGQCTRRGIALLAGVAPLARESGAQQGYRFTGHGRRTIRSTLYLAAMAARNSHSELRAFYEQLVGRGKKKLVALTAVMRKIIVIANARIRDWEREQRALET